MDGNKRACLIESDEEDEDGNLSSVESEPSMGEGDEEYQVNGDLSDDSSNASLAESKTSKIENYEDEDNLEDNSKSSSSVSKISEKAKLVDLPEDSSSFQLQDQDDTNTLDGDDSSNKTESQIIKTKPTGNKNLKLKNSKPQNKFSTAKAKGKSNSLSSEENSNCSSIPPTSVNGKRNLKIKFTRQPTPLCDAIMKDHLAANPITERAPEKRALRARNNNNRYIDSDLTDEDDNDDDDDDDEINGQSNEDEPYDQSDEDEVISQSNKLEPVSKVDPISLDIKPSETNSIIITDPLLQLVKKEESDIKVEIKEELDYENKEDVEELYVEDESIHSMEGNELRQSSQQNPRKRTKRRKDENEDDPSYSPQPKKQRKLSNINKFNNKPEKPSAPNPALSKIQDSQSPNNSTRRQGRPFKNQVHTKAEVNEDSENTLMLDVPEIDEANSIVRARKVSSDKGPSGDTQRPQPEGPRKRGRPAKANVAKSSLSSQKESVPSADVARSAINHNFDVLPSTFSNLKQVSIVLTRLSAEDIQNMLLPKEEPNEAINLKLPENNTDPLSNSFMKTDNELSLTNDQENVFDKNDLLCLQQLDNPTISSKTVKMTTSTGMTAKETNSFVADYLVSHQSVFDNSFFQNIFPVLSEILMLCMDEFTELLIRSKKAQNCTSETLRQQEVRLAIQSFCAMVSTYSEKFFPNFNSVIFKINQNKTKKGLIIALVFFLANSLWVKAPKFKGQLHTIRKMLMCICQIRKISSPLFLAVLTTPDKCFNDELRLLLKILLVLQKKNVLAIPATALPETSSNDSIEEVCELMVSSSTSCSSVSDFTSEHPDIVAQFVKILKSEKRDDSQGITEKLDHILCMLRPNNHESSSENAEKGTMASGFGFSLTQQDRGKVLAESLKQNQVGDLDSLFESYLKSTNEDVKTEFDDEDVDAVESPTYKTLSSNPRFPMPAESVVKVEGMDCDNPLKITTVPESVTVSTDQDGFIPENDEQDPLSF